MKKCAWSYYVRHRIRKTIDNGHGQKARIMKILEFKKEGRYFFFQKEGKGIRIVGDKEKCIVGMSLDLKELDKLKQWIEQVQAEHKPLKVTIELERLQSENKVLKMELQRIADIANKAVPNEDQEDYKSVFN